MSRANLACEYDFFAYLIAKVAGSLQQSYGQLQSEVERLRRELAERDGELANTLEEKRNEKTRLLSSRGPPVRSPGDIGDGQNLESESGGMAAARGLRGFRVCGVNQ